MRPQNIVNTATWAGIQRVVTDELAENQETIIEKQVGSGSTEEITEKGKQPQKELANTEPNAVKGRDNVSG